jgi:hypothetical protein
MPVKPYRRNATKDVDQLRPYLKTVRVSTGVTDDDPSQYLLVNGTRDLLGNLIVASGVTIDGVDISAFKGLYDAHILSASAHHDPVTIGTGGLSAKLGVTEQVLTLGAINHSDLSSISADQHHTGFVGLEDHAGTAVTPAADDRIQFLAANGISVSGGTNTVTFDGSTLDMELMNVVFHQVSWAQFAIYENFHDATKRASPEPSTYPARIYCGTIDNGDDTTADRSFGFTSKTYADITTVLSSTATAVGENYLEDSAADWFDGQYVNYVLVDSESTAFDITGCTISLLGVGTLTIDGTPAAGAYSIRSKTPTTCVAFCSYLDSTNGGYGHVVLDVSFDGGANWQAVLQTEYSTSLLEGAVTMDYPGHDFCFKASVVNDGDGHGAIIYKVLVVTDPSVWG